MLLKVESMCQEYEPSPWLRAARFMGWYGRLSVL
jgi:hypothetical protein